MPNQINEMKNPQGNKASAAAQIRHTQAYIPRNQIKGEREGEEEGGKGEEGGKEGGIALKIWRQ